jgi:hypothetical protein
LLCNAHRACTKRDQQADHPPATTIGGADSKQHEPQRLLRSVDDVAVSMGQLLMGIYT